MENVLPVEIIRDILSRLPVECILQWKRVRKTWRNLPLLDDAHFAREQLHRQPQLLLDEDHNSSPEDGDHSSKPHLYHKVYCTNQNSSHIKVSFLFLAPAADQFSCATKKLMRRLPYYGEYDCGNGKVKFKELGLHKQQFSGVEDPSFTLVGSCNGLVCLSVSDDPIYIYNPVTKEEMYLPRYDDKRIDIASGFGYIPSTNEYKVVRICHPKEPLSFITFRVGYVQVYTLGGVETSGGGDWRNKEQIDGHYLGRPETGHGYVSNGVLADGALHWLNYYDWKILAFDLAEEVFYEVPSPPCFESQMGGFSTEYFQLGVLHGNLCVYSQKGNVVIIWCFKKMTTNDNTISYKSLKGAGKIWRPNRAWINEVSLGPPLGSGFKENLPIGFTKTGEILFWYDRTILAVFIQKSRNVKKLMNGDFAKRVLQVIPHVNSFVPLKPLRRGLE